MFQSKHLSLFIYLLCATSIFGQKKIAVMDLRPLGPIPKGEITVLSERFRSQLVQTNYFEVMERKDLEALDQELATQMGDGFDEKRVAEAGRKQGAEFVVLGYIGLLQNTYTIDVRMVNCTAGRIDESYSETYKGDIEGLIKKMGKVANSMAGIEEKSKLWMYLTGGGVVTVATVAYLIWGVEDNPGLPEPPSPPSQ